MKSHKSMGKWAKIIKVLRKQNKTKSPASAPQWNAWPLIKKKKKKDKMKLYLYTIVCSIRLKNDFFAFVYNTLNLRKFFAFVYNTEFEEMVHFHLLGYSVVNGQGVPWWTQLGFFVCLFVFYFLKLLFILFFFF